MFIRVLSVVGLLFGVLLCSQGFALGPHELLVLADANSDESVRVARKFAELREVPKQNIVYLKLPADAVGQDGSISHADFTSLVWDPAWRAAGERRIDEHILAWAYSTHFPILIKARGGISIQGITFLRNRLPAPEDVRKGSYKSPLFTGPARPSGPAHFPQSLDVYRSWLGRKIPLPSMMLGYTGERGNTEEEVIRVLETGKMGDGTNPRGTVYFVKSANIRSKCRQWQFSGAARELANLGVDARITGDFPAGRTNVLGVMMGEANVKPRRVGRFAPGAMAEHLTSFGAVFSNGSQTKLTSWLRAGATASSGTVVEPMAIWSKFPSARFFVHYATGCTMLESFFQSIGSPLQILLVGDPLAAPWAPHPELMVEGLEAGRQVKVLELHAEVVDDSGHYGNFVYLLDGRIIAREQSCRLIAADLSAGRHALRVVAYRTGLVRPQVFIRRALTVGEGTISVERVRQ